MFRNVKSKAKFSIKTDMYCVGYTNDIYYKMKNDIKRTQWYYDKISKYCHNMRCIDIGCGSLALLSMECYNAGASMVYGIEINNDAFNDACKLIRNEGLNQDRIKLINKHCNDVTMNDIDDVKCDVIVHEIIGEIGSSEGVLFSYKNVKNNLINDRKKDHIISIPGYVKTYVSLVEFPDMKYWSSLDHKIIVPDDLKTINLWNYPERHFLCRNNDDSIQWHLMEHIDFESENINDLNEISYNDLEFNVSKDGIIGGLLSYIEIGMHNDDDILTSNPMNSNCMWANKLILFDDKITVSQGDTLSLNTHSNLANNTVEYSFELY